MGTLDSGLRRPLTVRAAALLALLLGCGSGRASPAWRAVPAGPLRPSWARARLSRASRDLFAALSARGPEALVALRLHGDEWPGYFGAAALERLARSSPGLVPGPGERRWEMLRALAGQPVVGWCARGVQLVEPGGVEGFTVRTLYAERLLVVGTDPGGYWAVWLQGLLWTPTGWRFVPWVAYPDMVERPRRDHTDVRLWDCDLEDRPDGLLTSGASPPP